MPSNSVVPVQVVLDTNCIIDQNFDWFSTPFSQLKRHQEEGNIEIFLPEVMDSEVVKQLREKTKKNLLEIKKVFDNNQYIVSEDQPAIFHASEFFSNESNLNGLMDGIIDDYNDFKRRLNITIIPTDNNSCQKVFERYFNAAPPFKAEGKKKHEFPDAFAIESIKSFHSARYCIVSNDNDWETSFKNEDNCDFFKSLSKFLSHVNEKVIAGQQLATVRGIIQENFSLLEDIVKNHFSDRGFMATDVPDDYVESASVDSLSIVDIVIDDFDINENMEDKYISFSVDMLVEYTAIVSYSDPDSWHKDDDTKEIFFLEKIESQEVKQELSINGSYTLCFDEDRATWDVTDSDTGLPNTIYFEVRADEWW
jgi:hypothetical protein